MEKQQKIGGFPFSNSRFRNRNGISQIRNLVSAFDFDFVSGFRRSGGNSERDAIRTQAPEQPGTSRGRRIGKNAGYGTVVPPVLSMPDPSGPRGFRLPWRGKSPCTVLPASVVFSGRAIPEDRCDLHMRDPSGQEMYRRSGSASLRSGWRVRGKGQRSADRFSGTVPEMRDPVWSPERKEPHGTESRSPDARSGRERGCSPDRGEADGSVPCHHRDFLAFQKGECCYPQCSFCENPSMVRMPEIFRTSF